MMTVFYNFSIAPFSGGFVIELNAGCVIVEHQFLRAEFNIEQLKRITAFGTSVVYIELEIFCLAPIIVIFNVGI